MLIVWRSAPVSEDAKLSPTGEPHVSGAFVITSQEQHNRNVIKYVAEYVLIIILMSLYSVDNSTAKSIPSL